jgi:hypothetical protein
VIFDEAALMELVKRGVREVLALRDDELLDAKSSGIGAAVFRREVSTGRLPAFRVGKRWVTRRRDLNEWVERQRVTPRKAPHEPANDADDALDAQLRAKGYAPAARQGTRP